MVIAQVIVRTFIRLQKQERLWRRHPSIKASCCCYRLKVGRNLSCCEARPVNDQPAWRRDKGKVGETCHSSLWKPRKAESSKST